MNEHEITLKSNLPELKEKIEQVKQLIREIENFEVKFTSEP